MAIVPVDKLALENADVAAESAEYAFLAADWVDVGGGVFELTIAFDLPWMARYGAIQVVDASNVPVKCIVVRDEIQDRIILRGAVGITGNIHLSR